MLVCTRMELHELPRQSAAVVVESAPLWVVWDMVTAGRYDLVVVVQENGVVRGVVPRDAVERLATRVPEAPVKMVPMQRALVVSAMTPLPDALALLGRDDIGALLLERPGSREFTALTLNELPEPEQHAIAV